MIRPIDIIVVQLLYVDLDIGGDGNAKADSPSVLWTSNRVTLSDIYGTLIAKVQNFRAQM